MQCPQCQADSPDGFRFCGQCGAALALRCGECQFENPPSMSFCGQCGRPLGASSAPAPALAAAVAEPEADNQPGRRQLTILFADLVGSTPLSYRLDPEDLRDLIRDYQERVAGIVQRYGGTVSRYMGDGVLCLFGYPRAHEDDGERAVHAGLDIVDVMRDLDQTHGERHAVRLAVRVGIATGLVVVGDIIGEGAAEEQAVVGETPNLAARLQSAAEPNTVVIAPSTRLLAGRVFDYEDMGERPVRGLPEPIRLWRVRGRRFVESRFELNRSDELTPMVGRTDQIAMLDRVLAHCSQGDGHAALIVGEGGVGKSRLAQTLYTRIEVPHHLRLRYQCSAHHVDSALYPVLTSLERNADISSDDDASTRLRKLDSLLHADTPSRDERLAALADLLGIDATLASATSASWSPRQRRKLVIDALLEQVDLLSRDRLVVVAYEDVHWIDPTSRELLDRMVERIGTRRVLLVLTSRPGFEAAWLGEPQVTTIALNRLDTREAARMARAVAGGHALPQRVLADIVAKADGVPLFVEELTKAVLQSGQLRLQDDRWQFDGALPSLTVPSTLQDSLIARLDQLSSVRDVAHTAAALGRDFEFGLLAALSPLPAERLRDAVSDLVDANILVRRGDGADETLSFRHALLQDACYESMLRSVRVRLHARIAEVLLSRFADNVSRQPEILAHHFSQAQRPELAFEHWLEAGRRASARSASVEAVRHFLNARDALHRLPDDDARAARELPLLTLLGAALINAEGPGSSEVRRVYARTRELRGDDDGDISPERFAALWGDWRICSNEWSARQLAIEMESVAHQRDDDDLRLQAHHAHWATLFVLGQLDECMRCVDDGLAVYDIARHAAHATLYGGHDAGVCGLGQSALVMALRGDFASAEPRMRESLALAGRIGHGASLAHGHDHQLMLLFYRREPAALLALAEDASAHAARHGCADYQARAETFAAYAHFTLGEHERGRAALHASITEQRTTMGDSDDLPVFLDMLAEAEMHAGEVDTALVHVDEALELAERNGMRHWLSELLVRRAALLAARGDGIEAIDDLLRDAAEQARAEGATLLLMRALTAQCELGSPARAPLATLRSVHDELAGKGADADIAATAARLQAAGA